jgi:uncharacterized membrane protein
MADINWPEGTGEWATSTVIVSRDARQRLALKQRHDDRTAVVATPLELIDKLEDSRHVVAKVVLVGAAIGELASFVRETYPDVALVASA